MAKVSVARTTVVDLEVDREIVMADPCYIDTDDGTLERNRHSGILSRGLGIVLRANPGAWVAEIETSDEGAWGERVSVLEARAVGGGREVRSEIVGHNGVDSGQMYVGCGSNLPLDYDALLKAYEDENGEWRNLNMLAFGGGAVSSTGYGDGVYPVEAFFNAEDECVRIQILFLADEDEDECQGCYHPESDCACCHVCGVHPCECEAAE